GRELDRVRRALLAQAGRSRRPLLDRHGRGLRVRWRLTGLGVRDAGEAEDQRELPHGVPPFFRASFFGGVSLSFVSSGFAVGAPGPPLSGLPGLPRSPALPWSGLPLTPVAGST